MAQSIDRWSSAHSSSLEFSWGQYRIWSATSRKQKAEITSWTLYVAALTIAGAVLGILSQQVADFENVSEWLPKGLALLSAASVAVAAYFTREILRPASERRWVRARSLAETLKSEIFLFRAGTPPYDGDDAAHSLLEQTNTDLELVNDLQPVILSDEKMRERLPEGPLTVDQYIMERIDDQIKGYYRPRAREYERLLERGRLITLLLGLLAVLLGAVGLLGVAAGWLAVITTITATVAAYLYSGRYQHLIISYSATATQLERLKTQWKVWGSPEDDLEKRSQFIRGCEEVISVENSAWMSKWTESSSDD